MPCDHNQGKQTEDQETPIHKGGGPAPDFLQGDISHVRAVPIHHLTVPVGISPGKDLSQPGAQGESSDRGVMDNRSR